MKKKIDKNLLLTIIAIVAFVIISGFTEAQKSKTLHDNQEPKPDSTFQNPLYIGVLLIL